GIDVLERGEDVAVDEFAVELASLDLVELLVREIEEVDGTSVEEVRVVRSFPDPRLDALESAEALCEAKSPEALHRLLVELLRNEFLADWAALLAPGRETAVDGTGAPSGDLLAALAAGTAASPRVADGSTGPDDLAVARLEAHDATLLVGRDGRGFRRRERAQLRALAQVADRVWSLVA
ncbi:MAG TPA: hypothetical protein VGU73_00755, partial [Acidimicrobiia bacterium]|nr:hypothetical protein [Acidimicrobiia bacterium]